MKSNQFHPLAVNIKKLQAYSGFFQLDERVMFEWFTVKADSFRTEYFYSVRRIAEETGIKKARLDTILKMFESLGIITYEAKGMPKTYHFLVNRQQVLELLPKIYNLTTNIDEIKEKDRHKFYEYSKLLSFFSKKLSENGKHKEYYKNSKEEDIRLERKGQSSKQSSDDSFEGSASNEGAFDLNPISAKTEEDKIDPIDYNNFASLPSPSEETLEDLKLEAALEYQEFLTGIYRQRLDLHNKDPKGKRKKMFANLAFNRDSRLLLYDLFAIHEADDIESSFIAYIDHVISGDVDIKKPIPYFLAKDRNKEFSTYFTYLDRFNTKYRLTERR